MADKAETVLAWADALNVANICFWNAAPELKLLVAKILSVRPLRIFDVSPGQMLFDELRDAEPFGWRVSLSRAQYFARLDGFVAKHDAGLPPRELCSDRKKLHVIPNGVAEAPTFMRLPPPEFILPANCDPALALGACCRIVADKQIEFLLDAMRILSASVPGASMTIVGGPDESSRDYFEDIRAQARDLNVFFVGEHEDALPFLDRFRALAMVSDREGCPNASLEAMSLGVPVVARRSDAIAEQVADGVNGFLVGTPEEMASRLAEILKSKRMRAKLGRAARATALKRFSMEKMAEAYLRLLEAR